MLNVTENKKEMATVTVAKCDFCHTLSYTVLVPMDAVIPGWVECTSGNGLYGGGGCCAPLDVTF